MLPRVVIDLDAADNKDVKPFEELSHAAKKQNLDGHIRRKTFQKVLYPAVSERKPRYQFKDRSSIRTASDLVTYAFTGDLNIRHLTDKSYEIDREKLGHATRVDRSSEMQDIAHEFIVDANQRVQDKYGFDFSTQSVERLRAILAQSHSLSGLQGLLSQYSSTREGCQVLNQCSKSIVASIKRLRRDVTRARGTTASAHILRMLNNLCLAMRSKGLVMDPILASRVMYYALQVRKLSIVKVYLSQYGHTLNHYEEYIQKLPVQLAGLAMEAETIGRHGALGGADTRNEALGLLTGSSAGTLSSGKDSLPSISKLLADSPSDMLSDLQRSYVFALAQLGLQDLLDTEVTKGHSQLKALKGDTFRKSSNLFSHLYGLAYILAGNIEKARESLNIRMAGETSRTFDAAVKDLCWQFLRSHYVSLNLHATPDLFKKISNDFRIIPVDVEEALGLFEKYLVKDHTRGPTRKDIGVREVDGQEVLVVFNSTDAVEGSIVYAKALRPSAAETGATDSL